MSTEGSEGKAGLPATVSSLVPAVSHSDTLESVVASIERMAKWIQQSGLYPACKTQAAAFAVLMQAKPRDSSPYSVLAAMSQVLNEYDVIGERLFMRAHAMAANFLRVGGAIKWHEYTREVASATFLHPTFNREGVTVTVTLDEMVQSGEATTWDPKANGGKGGWVLKANYAQRPHRMLRARCMSEGVDLVMPGIKLGMLTSEEAEDEPNAVTISTSVGQSPLPVLSKPLDRPSKTFNSNFTPNDDFTQDETEAAWDQNRSLQDRTNKESRPIPQGQSLPPSKPRPAPAPAPEEPEPEPKRPAPETLPGPSMAEKLAAADALPAIVKPETQAEPANYSPPDDPIRPDQMARLRELINQLSITKEEWHAKLDEYNVPMPDTPLPGQSRTPRMAELFSDEAADLIRELEARLDPPEATFGDPDESADTPLPAGGKDEDVPQADSGEVTGHPDDGHEMGQALLPGMLPNDRKHNFSTHRVENVPGTEGLQHCTLCGAAEVQLEDRPCTGLREPVSPSKPGPAASGPVVPPGATRIDPWVKPGTPKDGDPRVALILEGEKLAVELGYTISQLHTEAGGDLAEMEMGQLQQAVGRLRWTAQGKPGPDPDTARTHPATSDFQVPDAVRPEPAKRRGRPRKNPATT
jgi:hypothetical protein